MLYKPLAKKNGKTSLFVSTIFNDLGLVSRMLITSWFICLSVVWL